MKDLTKGNITKLILTFSLPILLGQLLQLTYSLVDTRIVGEILGEQALAAVGATNSVNTLGIGFMTGLMNGFAVMTAQAFGAGDHKKLKKTVAASFLLGTLIAAVLTIFSLVFLMPLLTVLNTPQEVIAMSYQYIFIIFAGMLISMFYNAFAATLRAIGDTVMPLIFLGVSVVLNIGGDYALIVFFHMGVRGAALATVASQLIATVLCYVYMTRKYEILRLHADDFRISMELVRKLFASGLSMGFMSSIVSLGTVALQSAINTFGTSIIVAHTAARKITELYMLLFSVFGTTMATYCGQNLGAGQIDRIKKGIRKVIGVTWIWCAGVIISSYTIAPLLVRMVTGTTDPQVLSTASLYLRIDTSFYFVPAMITILRNSMQGIGDCVVPIISSSIELVGKVLIVILLVPVLGYMGIILAEPIVWILMGIPLIVRMKTNPVLKTDK